MEKKKKVVPIDPLALTESLGVKTFRKAARRPWTKEEDAAFSRYMEEHYDTHNLNHDSVDWETVSLAVSTHGLRNSKDCRKRWANSLDPCLRRGRWEPEEDAKLVEAYERFGASWQKVSRVIPGRTDDQCAKRYIEVLDPSTKDRLLPWTHEEDLLLISLVRKHGTKWRTISAQFKSRPSLTCRNRWRKILTDVVRGKAHPSIRKEVESMSDKSENKVKDENDMLIDDDPEEAHKNHDHNDNDTPGTQVYEKPLERPMSTETEWRYTFSGNQQGQQGLPHSNLFGKNGGTIHNQELVQQLICYAKENNLEITVHQHIHHHYAPPPVLLEPVQVKQTHHHYVDKDRTAYVMEPETSMARYQHFNYLSPLAELPKLTSSASSPGSSKDRKENDGRITPFPDEGRITPFPEDRLTPLTQAVEMAVAAEAKRPDERDHREARDVKRMRVDDYEYKERNNDRQRSNDRPDFGQNYENNDPYYPYPYERQEAKNVFEIEEVADEEALNSYGVFYNVYTKEGSVIPETQPEQPQQDATSVYDAWGGGFGIIPFNPS